MKSTVVIEASTFSSPSRNAGNVRSEQSNAAQNKAPSDRADTSRDSFKTHLDRQAKLDDQKKLEHSQNNGVKDRRDQQDNTSRPEVWSDQGENIDTLPTKHRNIESESIGLDGHSLQSTELEFAASKLINDTGLGVQPNINNIGFAVDGLDVLGSVSDELHLIESGLSQTSVGAAGVNLPENSIDVSLSQYLKSSGVEALASPAHSNSSNRPLLSSGEVHLSSGLRGDVSPLGSSISLAVSGLKSTAASADVGSGQFLTQASAINNNASMSAGSLQNMSSNSDLISTKPDFLNNSIGGDLSLNSHKIGSMSLLDKAVANAKASEGDIAELASSSLDKSSSVSLFKTSAESVMASANARVQIPATMTFSQPGWAGMIADRTAMMASQKIEVADIQLDPPELGPLQIKVHVQNEQTTVSFVSGSQAVRESLEQASHRLKDMLEEQGLNLVDVDVSDRQNQDEDQSSEFLDGATDQNEKDAGSDDQLAAAGESVSIKVKSGIDDFV